MMRIKSGAGILLLLIVGTLTILGGCASHQADKPMAGQQAGNLLDDSYLTTAVKTQLLGDISLKSFDVHVTTRNRVVTLSGTLPSAALRDEAVRVANSVGGVVKVISEIEVKPQ